jgi:fibronectin-binding autotransporter adhesin
VNIGGYTGGTTVAGGTLQTSGTGVLAGFSPYNITSGTLAINGSTAQVIQSTITVSNSGNLTISTAALTTSTLIVNGGTVNVNGASLTTPFVQLAGSGTININNTFSPTTFSAQNGTVNINFNSTLSTLTNLGGGGSGSQAIVNIASGITWTNGTGLTFDATGSPNGAQINGPGLFTFATTTNRTITVADSTAVDNDLTIGAVMTSSASFTKAGNGTLYLTGVNTLANTVTLAAGTLQLGNISALGTSTLFITGGSLQADGSAQTLTNAVWLWGNANFTGSSALTLTNNVTLTGASRTISFNNSGAAGSEITLTNVILSETGAVARLLTISGTGRGIISAISDTAGVTAVSNITINGGAAGLTLTLSGANQFGGTTSLINGTVYIADPLAFGTGASTITTGTNGNANAVNTAILTVGSINFTRNIGVNSNTTTPTASSFTFGGATAVTSTFSGLISFSNSINLAAVTGGTAVFSNNLTAANLTQGITKTGGGTVLLLGSNVYSGTTSVFAGTLRVGSNNALGTTAQIQVNTGAVLDLNGFNESVTTLTDGPSGGGSITTTAAAQLTVTNGTFSGVIAGANMSLSKTGAGTLILVGNNTYNGTTTIQAGGTLQIGNGVANSGGLLGGGNIVNSGTLAFNRVGSTTYGGAISGNGIVTITAGTITFTNDSNYSGGTTIASGATLRLGIGGSTGNITGNIFNNGLLQLDHNSNYTFSSNVTGNGGVSLLSGTVTINNSFTYSGGTTIALGATLDIGGGSASGSVSNTIYNNGSLRINRGDATVLTNTIVGSGDVTIASGTVTLTGDSTYSGITTINSGATLRLGNNTSGGNITGSVYNAGTLAFNHSNSITYGGIIDGAGNVAVQSGTIAFSNPQTYTGDTTVSSGATLVLGGTLQSSNITDSGVISFAGSQTFNTTIVGDGAVTVESGTVNFVANQNYTGVTSINGGTLKVNGTLASSSVFVNAGGTLGGTGTINGAVTLNGGVLSAGNSPGTITLSSLILSGGSLFYELGANTSTQSDNIFISSGTTPIINSATVFNFTNLSGFGLGTYTLISGYSGLLSNFGLLSTGTSILNGHNILLQNNSGELDLYVYDPSSTSLVWSGTNSSTWDRSTSNWTGVPPVYGDGVAVVFNDSTTVTNVTVTSGNVSPLNMTVNASQNYIFSGGSITTTDGLLKQGTGTVTFNNQVTFNGGASVSAGTLVTSNTFNGAVGVGTSANVFVASGGVLTGALTQSGGTVTVSSGGKTTGALALNGGSFTVKSGGDVSSTPGITIGASAAMNVNNGGVVSGNGTITVSGLLNASGTVGGGSVTVNVNNSGMLTGDGTVKGSVVISTSGQISAGETGVGKLTIDATGVSGNTALTLNKGSVINFEFRNAQGTVAGTDWDLIDLGTNGKLVIDADNQNPANQIKVYVDSWNLLNTAHGANNFDASPAVTNNTATTYDWLFLKVDAANINVINPHIGSIGGRFMVIDDADGAGVFGLNNPYTRPVNARGQGTFKVIAGDFGSGYGLYIHYSAIPEPGSMILAGLASLGAGWYGRRRRRQAAASAASDEQPAAEGSNDSQPTA